VPSQAGHLCSAGFATLRFIRTPTSHRQRGTTDGAQSDRGNALRLAGQRADGPRCTAE
jgi:hypothetical protein